MTFSWSNVFTILIRLIYVAFVVAIILFAFSWGCGPHDAPPIKYGVKNWKVTSMRGPIELRPLPPAHQVYSDYQQWLQSDNEVKARLYETTLVGATNQVNFRMSVGQGDTPLGQAYSTSAEFIYRDPTNGSYRLTWGAQGRQDTSFLKLSNEPRKVWLEPSVFSDGSGIPHLKIVAFEGLEPRGQVMGLEGDDYWAQ